MSKNTAKKTIFQSQVTLGELHFLARNMTKDSFENYIKLRFFDIPNTVESPSEINVSFNFKN